MTIISPTPATELPSAAVTTAQELAALAARLRSLTITPAERQQVCKLLADAAEALASTTNGMSADVYEEASPLSRLTGPDGSMSLPGQLQQELEVAGDQSIGVRDALRTAATIVEEMEQQAALAARHEVTA
ncbi:hypothetical protein GCM10017559_07810 [Streptosporangium longisporum]|uniref:Uncharacterized protein n=1 Tax=Streptosporangium longisporum TaxID=46187 RepID=A0ABN3XTI2_9ACTN